VEDPEDAVEDGAMVLEGVPRLVMTGPVRQEGLDPGPLLVGEFVAVRRGPPIGATPFLRFTDPEGLPNTA
jgi:hypothetical protein